MITEKLNLTLSELAAAKNDFAARYQPAQSSVSFPWNIAVNWAALQHTVESAIAWPSNQTLLRFIHRYDEQGWFLTMECCHVAGDGTIDSFGPRFDLRNGTIQPTVEFTKDYDQAYFDNVLYEDNPLVRGMHVNYVMLPWSQELKEAANVNWVLTSEEINIVFSSISFDFGIDPARVNVRWPHTMAFHFSGPEGDLLDDVVYSGGPIIKAKAYDYADPCPSNCSNSYSWHSFFNDTKPYQD